MLETIERTLQEIEQKHQIRILYAVESGSRAWGFASPDSDYDVRYIYVRRMEDYLRVDNIRDTIEGPLDDVLDFSGWDLRKTLELLRRTNPSLMEWAQSPIVYRTTPEWERVTALISRCFNPVVNMYHYLSMAEGNEQTHLRAERVKLKKYLYALRPVLCCRWLEKYHTVPPVPFDKLCEAVLPKEMVPVTQDLLRRKQAAGEGELAEHIPALDDFLRQEIERLKQVVKGMEHDRPMDYEVLNALFRDILGIDKSHSN